MTTHVRREAVEDARADRVFGAAAPVESAVMDWESDDWRASAPRVAPQGRLFRRVVAVSVCAGPASRAVVRALRREGARLALLVERPRAGRDGRVRRPPRRRDSLRIEVDPRDPGSCRRAVAEVVSALGPLEAFVVCDSRGGSEQAPRRRSRPIALSSVAAAAMRPGGTLIFASRGDASSAPQLVATTRAWSHALSPFGIRVNAVDTGAAAADSADEAARCCVFLAGAESYPATGRTYRLRGAAAATVTA